MSYKQRIGVYYTDTCFDCYHMVTVTCQVYIYGNTKPTGVFTLLMNV